MEERNDQIILGRLVGTATGWDASDDYAFVLYDFEPVSGLDLPKGTVNFDFTRGRISTFNDAGEEESRVDMIEALAKAPVAP